MRTDINAKHCAHYYRATGTRRDVALPRGPVRRRRLNLFTTERTTEEWEVFECARCGAKKWLLNDPQIIFRTSVA